MSGFNSIGSFTITREDSTMTTRTANLAARLDSMPRILAVMLAFGLVIGAVFPFVAEPFVTWDPGEKIFFRVICLVAGLAVGVLCFFLVKLTIYPKNQLLARQKAEWEASFNSLSEGIALLDASGAVIRVNHAFEEMVSINEAALRGRKLSEIMAERCTRQDGDHLVTRAIYTGESQEGESSLVGMVCSQAAHPILGERDEVVGCVFVLRDVTEKRRLHQQMVQSARMSAVNHLVSGAAHEINNPLMGVTGITELIQRRDDIDERLRSDLETILQEARRASGIVKRLLDHVASGSSKETRELDLNDVLREALELKDYNLRSRDVRLNTSLHAGSLPVLADAEQLRQVIFHIIDNAEKALAEVDGGRLLEINSEREGAVARMHFVDNGPGVPEAAREHIFDPFFTTREVGQGTGLGLTMSYGIISDLGGRLWLEDTDNGGAHFVMELPLTYAEG